METPVVGADDDVDRAWANGDVQLGVHRVLAYDNDFAVYRFGRDRRRAFEVVR